MLKKWIRKRIRELRDEKLRYGEHIPEYYTSLEHLEDIFDRNARQMAFAAENLQEAEAWKKDLRERLREITGISRLVRAELSPRLLETVRKDGYSREKWLIQTEPDIWMPFYVLVPDGRKDGAKLPCIIAPHGHKSSGKNGVAGRTEIPCVDEVIRETRLAYGPEFAKRGYMVFCPDARGFGERRESVRQGDSAGRFMNGCCEQLNHMAIPLGLTLCGMWIFDLMRLTDYILTREDCDPDRIACAGLSGGGMQTLYFTALDDRIRCCVISGYFYGVKESLLEMPGSCSCNYVPHMWETCDMGDVGALIAPRPMLVETGNQDPLSGRRGTENVKEQLEITEKAFRLYGVPERLVWHIFDGPHRWDGEKTPGFIGQYL